jgi:CRISPR system Cascade subunit CasA
MTEPYSLAVEPWLPVAMADGARTFIPIRDIANPNIIAVNTGRADCDISVTEFLIGLAAISLAPDDERDWVDLFHDPPTPEDIGAALQPFANALVLDGPGPRFLQDFEPLQGEEVPVSSLLMDSPGANTLKENADHFVKRGQVRTLSRAGAAIALLTLQTSAPSGGAGHRTSMRGGGPVTTLVVPRLNGKPPNLWQLIWANTLLDYRVDPADAAKAMPWLAPTRTSGKGEPGATTTPAHHDVVHKAQAFFGMPRRIRLNFAQNTGSQSCDLLGLKDAIIVQNYVTRPYGVNYTNWIHPLSPYYRQNEKTNDWLPLHFKSSVISYKSWVGLTLRGSDKTRLPADVVHNFIKNRARSIGIKSGSESRSVGLLACGYAMDNMKPLDFTEAMLPLISTGDENRDRDLADCALSMVQAAELTASQLLTALKVALFSGEKVDNSKTVLEAPRARFWAETEADFYRLLREAASVEEDPEAPYATLDHVAARWLPVIRNTALRIFDETAPIDAPENPDLEEIVKGRSLLHFCVLGYGPMGKKIYEALQITPPEKKKAQGKAA